MVNAAGNECWHGGKVSEMGIARECTKEEVLASVKRNNGLVYLTARELGVTQQTIHNYCVTWPEVKQAILDAREMVLDEAEKVVQRAAKNGEMGASMWLLRTLGRSRGYGDKVEHQHSGTVEHKVSGAVEVDVTTLSQDIAVALLDQLRAAKEKQDSTPLLEHKPLDSVGGDATVPEKPITVKMGRKRDKNTREGKGSE